MPAVMHSSRRSRPPRRPAKDFSALAVRLAEKSLRGSPLSRAEARRVLACTAQEMPALLSAVFRVRRAFFGRKVKLHFLANIQSGVCPEDCAYCSQSRVSKAPVERYRLLPPRQILGAAENAVRWKASRLCLVASGRQFSQTDAVSLAGAIRTIKRRHPRLEICCSLGFLPEPQARLLRDAGVEAYNHNLNTSERFYRSICSTHGYAERLETIARARAAGFHVCSGAVFGMGETPDDVVRVAFHLRKLGVESIPVNFLIPVPGTPLEGRESLTPLLCLKILCLFRLVCPRSALRIAGGRELHLRSLQPLALFAANAMFVGDYLTTGGAAAQRDIEMIQDMGFEILGGAPPEGKACVAGRVKVISSRKAFRWAGPSSAGAAS